MAETVQPHGLSNVSEERLERALGGHTTPEILNHSALGVGNIGSDVEERAEREGALREPRMRDDEAGLVDGEGAAVFVHPEDVEIDGARRVRNGAHATELGFDRLQSIEERDRRAVPCDEDGRVQVVGGRPADGLRLVDAGAREHRSERRDATNRFSQCRQSIAEVRAERDHGSSLGLRLPQGTVPLRRSGFESRPVKPPFTWPSCTKKRNEPSLKSPSEASRVMMAPGSVSK